MERHKKTPLLFLFLALHHVCANTCPSLPDKNLSCYTDYNRTITCVWNSTYVSDHADSVCTIHAKKEKGYFKYNSSCELEPVDASRPMMKKCSLIFQMDEIFQSFHVLTISLSCDPVKQILNISYKPACNIKLNPPPEPDTNSTTVSWVSQVSKHAKIKLYNSQLQWKREDQSWSDPSVQKNTKNKACDWVCITELYPDLLIQDERYEARVRVQPNAYWANSVWSDWSPTASWVSPIGRTKPTPTPTPTPPPPPDAVGSVLGIVALIVFVLCLAVILLRTDKTTWIYIVKRIRGPPLPNPAKSSLQDVNFQNWLSPHFTSESFHSFWKPIEIVSVEVTSTVDVVAPSGPQAALLEKMRSESSYDSTNSSYSNPSYSQISPPPPFSSLTAGNLELCGTDICCGPVGSQSEGKNAAQDRDEVRVKEVEFRKLLSKGSNIIEPMLVNSDYEKVEKPQMERFRLQSLDSGMCSGEEVSQESLEADSINVTDSHDEGPEGKEEREGRYGKEIDIQKLFGGSGGIFGKGSIQVCSDYERVQKLQADSPELTSLDSGIISGGEGQMSQEESLEDVDKSTESTSLLFPPPHPSSALPCSLPSFTPLLLNFSGLGSSPALRPLPSHIPERIVPVSTNRSVEPSGDGYMPARQEQS